MVVSLHLRVKIQKKTRTDVEREHRPASFVLTNVIQIFKTLYYVTNNVVLEG